MRFDDLRAKTRYQGRGFLLVPLRDKRANPLGTGWVSIGYVKVEVEDWWLRGHFNLVQTCEGKVGASFPHSLHQNTLTLMQGVLVWSGSVKTIFCWKIDMAASAIGAVTIPMLN